MKKNNPQRALAFEPITEQKPVAARNIMIAVIIFVGIAAVAVPIITGHNDGATNKPSVSEADHDGEDEYYPDVNATNKPEESTDNSASENFDLNPEANNQLYAQPDNDGDAVSEPTGPKIPINQ